MSLVVMPFAYMDKIFSSMLIFFGTAILSGHNKNLRWGASILHHIEDLHKVWNGPAESVPLGPNLLSSPCAASVAFPSPLRSLSHYIIFPVIRGLCQQPQVGPRLPHRNRNAPGQHSAIRTHEITLFFYDKNSVTRFAKAVALEIIAGCSPDWNIYFFPCPIF